MPTHSALRCVVNCGLRTAYCTWRLANARFVRAPVSGISVRTDWTGRDVRFGTKEVVEVSKSSKARASRIPMVIPSHPVSFSLSLISSNSPSHPSRPSIHPSNPSTFLTHLTANASPTDPSTPPSEAAPSISSGCCSHFLAVPDCLIPIRVKR
ncbi:hypothetical protein CLIM01_03383 [Colletotrichum limetticola]|uniref:Uncharacterized protein n=1 Tax=Colletotrichum limetticola TaxID=1209924 RepID=A0ABQ9Q649_9PEZI|nr:hypothetical protein CLIM01_03383 [Colletotrichum limetticola]